MVTEIAMLAGSVGALGTAVIARSVHAHGRRALAALTEPQPGRFDDAWRKRSTVRPIPAR